MVMTVTKLKHEILGAFSTRREGDEFESNVELFELQHRQTEEVVSAKRFSSKVRA